MSTRYATAAHEATDRAIPRSREAARAFCDLRDLPPEIRREILPTLQIGDLVALMQAADAEAGSPFALYQDDPRGFAEHVLMQSVWRRQAEILDALPRSRRVAVPSCFASGKTYVGAMALLWHGECFPIGTTLTVSTATRFRQVQRQMWPEVRMLHGLAGLRGEVDTTQWKMDSSTTRGVQVAYGFATPAYDESAVQGIHARGGLLLIVDESGGMSQIVGESFRALLTGEGTHLLAIGNPATDDEDSWFETLCRTPGVIVVPIDVFDTPNFTGEATARCYACPKEVPPHRVQSHLVDQEWERDTRRDHGTTSAYYQSKARARFPKNATRRAIPAMWVDDAVERAKAGTGNIVTVRDRISGAAAAAQPEPGAWVRLGVDVAADGGDELVISRVEGEIGRIVHVSSGAQNAHAMTVAGVVLEQIREAERLREVLGTPDHAELRVKIDVIGLGWGVVGVLDAWAKEQVHSAVIVAVDVREGIDERRKRRPEHATLRPALKRDELWLAGRALLQPGSDGRPSPRLLDVDERTAAQLSGPDYTTNSGGLTVIESKKSMRKRGLSSPDRAEALLLGFYEPVAREKRRLIRAGA